MIRTLTSKTLVIFFALCVLGGLQASIAQAAKHMVTPLVFNLDLEKRDIVTKNITLINTSAKQVRVYATVNNVADDGEGIIDQFVQVVESDQTNTATTWIEITRGRITLQPNETKEIPFTVKMHPNTLPGDYNVFLSFAEASNRPQAQAKANRGDSPGTIIHISVDQEQNAFLRLENFGVDKFVTKKDTETVKFTLSNPGVVPVNPKGEIIFYNNNGKEISSIPLNTSDTPVPAAGEQDYIMEVPTEFTMGKYKAFLSVEYGEFLTASVHDTAFFYILPIKTLIIIFFIVLILAVIIALYVHRRYDKIDDSDDGSDTVAMTIREGTSENLHHDIDLSKKDETH